MKTSRERKVKNYGLVIPKIETREEGAEHVLGRAEKPVINEKGDWLPYAPDREPQSKNGVETNGCTIYGTLTALEALVFFLTGVRVNYTDRYPLRVAAQRKILDPKVGADPHQIAELLRTVTGTLAEERDPWHDGITTVEQYYDLKGLTDLLKEGPAWYKEWELTHDWVWTGSPTPKEKRRLLKEAQKKGPVCVSVYAWQKRNGLYYKPEGARDNHWTWLPKIKQSEDIVFDSYDTFIKELEPNYDYALAKVYYLTKRKPKPHVFLKNLGYGMTHPDVAELQKALVSLGYPIPHAVTDQFLLETTAALAQFQKKHGIVDDGSHFGPQTRYAMNKALAQPQSPIGALVLYLQTIFAGLWTRS